jgi:hypothetical protein
MVLVIRRWTKSARFACALFATAAYFLMAYWLTITYQPRNLIGEKVLLFRPYIIHLDSRFAAMARDVFFSGDADSVDNNERSTLLLYEDDRLLGPAHSTHADIAKLGMGRFSHWRNNGSVIIFSSSDNSDPNTNGRIYSVLKQPAVTASRPK